MINFAVLGVGRIGKIHAQNVHQNPNCTLKVVADPWIEGTDQLAKELNCSTEYDYFKAIERDDVNAILIGTPTEFHVSLMLHAVRLGKPVLCEKPIDKEFQLALDAVKEVEKYKGQVMLAFNRRFDPDTIAVKNAINANEIGDIRQVIITSRDPGLPSREYLKSSGGILKDMTIHDFDMARFLLGEEPVQVQAIASRLVDPTIEEFGDYDSVMVLLKTKSGKQCVINGSREAVYGFDQRLEVLGSKGMLRTENHKENSLQRYSSTYTQAQEPLLNFFLERHALSYKIELDKFIDAVTNNNSFCTTPFDGLMALHIALCAEEAVRTGQVVKINDLREEINNSNVGLTVA